MSNVSLHMWVNSYIKGYTPASGGCTLWYRPVFLLEWSVSIARGTSCGDKGVFCSNEQKLSSIFQFPVLSYAQKTPINLGVCV